MSFRKLPWALWRRQIVAVVRLEIGTEEPSK
jgi:hypothetical protein